MKEKYDTTWEVRETPEGHVPEDARAFDRKFQEWERRDWPKWLEKHLVFPFSIRRVEDEDDAYFMKEIAEEPFRLGHKMKAIGFDEDLGEFGLMLKVQEGKLTGAVPMCDVEVTPKSNANYWPLREYVVWFANR